MKQNFKKISAGSATLRDLQERVYQIKNEGRSREWESRQIQNAVSKTKETLKDLSKQRKAELIYQNELAEKIVEPSRSWNERNYHLNRAAALANGRKGDELVKLYRNLMNDPESRQFKGEYEAIFKPNMAEGELDMIRQEYLTEDERHQQKFKKAIKAMSDHVQTIEGLENQFVDEIAHGDQPDFDSLQLHLDRMKENAEKQGFKEGE